MRETVRSYLENDAELMATLTGGLYTQTEIGRSTTPAAFDAGGDLLPCALLRVESEAPTGPFPTSSRQILVLYLYQQRGCDAIDVARDRIYALLHRHKFTTARTWTVRHAGDVLDVGDEALGASLALSRYEVIRGR